MLCCFFKDFFNKDKAPSVILLIFNPDIAAGNNPTGEKAENLPERLISKSIISKKDNRSNLKRSFENYRAFDDESTRVTFLTLSLKPK